MLYSTVASKAYIIFSLLLSNHLFLSKYLKFILLISFPSLSENDPVLTGSFSVYDAH